MWLAELFPLLAPDPQVSLIMKPCSCFLIDLTWCVLLGLCVLLSALWMCQLCSPEGGSSHSAAAGLPTTTAGILVVLRGRDAYGSNLHHAVVCRNLSNLHYLIVTPSCPHTKVQQIPAQVDSDAFHDQEERGPQFKNPCLIWALAPY